MTNAFSQFYNNSVHSQVPSKSEVGLKLTKTKLTFKMCEGTECSSGAVAGVDDVIAFGGLVDLGVELLLRPGVTVLAGVPRVAIDRVPPLVRRLDRGTRSRSVLVLLGASSSILVVVELGAGVSLPRIIIIVAIEFDSNRAPGLCTDW